MSVSYATIHDAQENILRALRREGGELSSSELVLTTQLPYDVVISVVRQLAELGKVELHKAAASEIEIIHLK
jgi:hypothetical protein